MPTTVWPTLIADDITSGKGFKTTLQPLLERDRVVEQAPSLLRTGDLSTTLIVDTTVVASRRIIMPGAAISGRLVKLALRLRIAAGSSATLVSFRFKIGATFSTTATHNSGTYAMKEAILTLASDVSDTLATLDVILWSDLAANAVEATTDRVLANMRYSD